MKTKVKKSLIHYKDTTIGLWCTDRIDFLDSLIERFPEKKVDGSYVIEELKKFRKMMFQLKK